MFLPGMTGTLGNACHLAKKTHDTLKKSVHECSGVGALWIQVLQLWLLRFQLFINQVTVGINHFSMEESHT